ncbi:MAG: aminoacyl-histidine dipeptidase, partial [Bacteroidetes bacterium]|nr:aminoacyl-histidine dipeptidase [Bacteroidota bacterium]
KDEVGNVLISKPATPGMEDRPKVVLQSHLDMVHQKNNDTDFNFETQGINSYIDGDWVKAKGTTLGADNGMGVAAAMAVLASSNIPHPAIEALFTIDEETGMTGAKGLKPGFLTGKIMLNLDTEDDDELCIGCAGGLDTNVSWNYREEPAPETHEALKIEVKGLKGGHSGVDIHLQRGNANKIMNRLLWNAPSNCNVRVSGINGGSLRNAIPRESVAIVLVENSDAFRNYLDKMHKMLLEELSSADPGLIISASSAGRPERVMNKDDQRKLLNAVYAVPNGVYRMSTDIPDLVETSSSLARIIVENGTFISQSLQRSSVNSAKSDIAAAVRATFELMGAEVQQGGDYPGWKPLPDAPILHTMQNLYTEMFAENPHVRACHAGLECGLIGEHYPGMHMISFGPTIKNPHSPDEKVNIASVSKFWEFLKKTLREIPNMN